MAARPAATVHAFEPTPELAAGLRETAALNGLDRLHVHEMAVSEGNGQAVLRRFRGELGTNEGMNFTTTASGALPDAELVPAVCLDSFCVAHAIERIDLLKIDIQGNEPEALAGARHLLDSGRVETIFIELNWGLEAGPTCSATKSIGLLEHAGYRFSKPGSRLNWKSSGPWMRALSDVVARRMGSGQVC
jgi:FkbM family methyltransferase